MYKISVNILLLCIAGTLSAPPAHACGPNFPSDVLSSGDEAMLAAPIGDFRFEVDRLLPKQVSFRHVEPPAKDEWAKWLSRRESARAQTETADIADVAAALQARGAKADVIDAAKKEIAALRALMKPYQTALAKRAEDAESTPYSSTIRQWYNSPASRPAEPATNAAPKPPLPAPPAKDAWRDLKSCPEEFILYARGALALYNGDTKTAREAWTHLLALKPEDRRYRSTWAAYMLARVSMADDPAAAITWFKKTRALAKEGFVDTTGLAAASLGWQARTHLDAGQFEEAFELYIMQTATGDEGGYESLRRTAFRALKEDRPVLTRLASDENSQRVITAALVCQYMDTDAKKQADRWLAAVEKTKQRAAGFDRLAWSAYRAGDFDTAKRFLASADEHSALANWLRAKMALRAGNKKDAATFLAKAAAAFPRDEAWQKGKYLNGVSETNGEGDPDYRPARQVAGELAVLKLNRGDYTESLALLLDQGWWSDAVYVAEQVLTLDELKQFVEKRPQSKENETIRSLLARALMRAGRWKEALQFFDADTRNTVEAYVAGIRKGQDKKLPNAERAAALMDAARIARAHGMSILATEGPPDYAIYLGSYGNNEPFTLHVWGRWKINAASADEKNRIANVQLPTKRYHYRYVAADHAWAAAQLMPDNSKDLAEWLCEAGGWLKHRDPKAADRFYKALVKRCPATDLGQEADRLRWFPVKKDPKSPEQK